MPSSKEFLNYVLDQLSNLEDISYRYMMAEYIIYYKGKIAGGIFNNRLMIKPVKAAMNFLKEPVYDIPFDGAKEWILIEDIDDKDFLTNLFKVIYDDLSFPKKKSTKKKDK